MVRAVAMSAASALCLIWTAGCASSNEFSPKAPAAAINPVGLQANAAVGAPNLSTLPDTLDGEIQRAKNLRSKGNYDEAVRALAQLMLVAPDDSRVVGEYGKALEQQGHSQEALSFLKRAVELDPRDSTLYSALGIAYDQLDQHAKAQAAYQRALALEPSDPAVLNNYAVSRMLSGDYAGAQKLFAEASRQGGENPKISLNLQKLATLDPKRSDQPAPTPAPVVTARIAPPPSLVVKADLAPVARTASAKPRSLVTSTAPKPGPQVVMERVPVDPLAGPVARVKHPARTLAKGAAPKTVASKSVASKPTAPTPSLRTAADSD